MAQTRGEGTGNTSAKPKEPVVLRKPAKVFFTSAALAKSSTVDYDIGLEALEKDVLNKMLQDGTKPLIRALPNPFVFVVGAAIYSKGLNSGESEYLESVRGDQLYRALENGPVVGAYARLNVTVSASDYLSDYELRELAQEKGRARTRVRHRFESDPDTGEVVDRSYDVGERSGLDRVRVRFAKPLNGDLWSFEDPLTGSTLVWSRGGEKGQFDWGSSQTTAHDGSEGGYTTPPTPIPEPRGMWGLPNPVQEPLPPVPGTPIPETKKPEIEYLPIEERDFNDYIIVDPQGTAPAIYVYFSKAKANFLETGYYGILKRKSKQGRFHVDHIPSQAAVRFFLRVKYPSASEDEINEALDNVASVTIPKEVHMECSETYGGRNNSIVYGSGNVMMKKKELDAMDLEKAGNDNWDRNAECLKKHFNVSDERIEEIRNELHELNRKKGLY